MAKKVSVQAEGNSNAGGMISGIIIVACVLVGFLIWKFLMGASANFEGGDAEKGHPLTVEIQIESLSLKVNSNQYEILNLLFWYS